MPSSSQLRHNHTPPTLLHDNLTNIISQQENNHTIIRRSSSGEEKLLIPMTEDNVTSSGSSALKRISGYLRQSKQNDGVIPLSISSSSSSSPLMNHHHDVMIEIEEDEGSRCLIGKSGDRHDDIVLNRDYDFEMALPRDALLVISEFLDCADTMFNLTHVCSSWFYFLARESRFWKRVYKMKNNALKKVYLKDFDLYVQERVVLKRMKMIQKQNLELKQMMQDEGDITHAMSRQFYEEQQRYYPYRLGYTRNEHDGETVGYEENHGEDNGLGQVLQTEQDIEMEDQHNLLIDNSGYMSSGYEQVEEDEDYGSEFDEERDLNVTPLLFKKFKAKRRILGIPNLYEKDLYLELIQAEKRVKLYDREIFKKKDKVKTESLNVLSRTDYSKLKKIEQSSVSNTVFWIALFHIFLTFFIISISAKGILMELGVDYESSWNWILYFIPGYLAIIMTCVFSLVDFSYSWRRFIIGRKLLHMRTKYNEALILKKNFFDSLMTSGLILLISIEALIMSIFWNAFLMFPHSYYGQNGWILLIVFIVCGIGLVCFVSIWLFSRTITYNNDDKWKRNLFCYVMIMVLLLCMSFVIMTMISIGLTVSTPIGWGIALIPLFSVEGLALFIVSIIGVLWCFLEFSKTKSYLTRCAYISLYLSIILTTAFLILHHWAIINYGNLTFGFATLLLLPISAIFSPTIALSMLHINSTQRKRIMSAWKRY